MTAMSRIIDALRSHGCDPKPRGRGYRARCPAHDDRNPSLDIDEGDDGRVLMTCRAGCDNKDIVARIGKTMADLMPDHRGGTSDKHNGKTRKTATKAKRPFDTLEAAIQAGERSTKGKHRATYTYKVQDGSVVGAMVRFDLPTPEGEKQRKTFRPFHVVPGGWQFGDPPDGFPLYRRDKLILDASVPIHVFEGEGCADAAAELGLNATATAHGADGVSTTDLTPLQACTVCIWPDNDRAGEDYAEVMAARLTAQGCNVRICQIPGLPDKGDVVDYIESAWENWAESDDAIKAKLDALADSAPVWQPAESDALPDGEADSQPSGIPERWRPVRITDLGDEESAEFIVEGIIARGGTTLLSSKAKVGKTTMLTALCHAMRDGGVFITPVEAGRILIVTEEGRSLWKQRQELRDIGPHVFLIVQPFITPPSYSQWAEFCRHVAQVIEQYGIALVVIDTFSKVSPVENENDAAEVSRAMMALNVITETGAGLLVIHHRRKSDGNEGDAIRGSGAFAASVDVIIEMQRCTPNCPTDRRRVLSVMGRFSECPTDKIVIEWDGAAGYQVIGNWQQAQSRDRWTVLKTILLTEPLGLSVDEIKQRWPDGESASKRTLTTTLMAGCDSGRVAKTGKGKRGDPYRFYLRLPDESEFEQPPRERLARIESAPTEDGPENAIRAT